MVNYSFVNMEITCEASGSRISSRKLRAPKIFASFISINSITDFSLSPFCCLQSFFIKTCQALEFLENIDLIEFPSFTFRFIWFEAEHYYIWDNFLAKNGNSRKRVREQTLQKSEHPVQIRNFAELFNVSSFSTSSKFKTAFS